MRASACASRSSMEASQRRAVWSALTVTTRRPSGLKAAAFLPGVFPDRFLEIKSRTWSRADAEKKADLIGEILRLLKINLRSRRLGEYTSLAW